MAVWALANAISTIAGPSSAPETSEIAQAVEPVVAPEAPPPPPPAFVFDDPLPGRGVDSPFGLRQMPWEEGGRLHEGVDIAAPAGAPVHVATDGVVLRGGVSSTYGRFVEVAHKGGFRTFYAHLSRDAGLKRGAFVRRGVVVAYVGDSGRSTGSHLHFELRTKAGKPLNPALFMGKTFARADDLPLKAAAKVGRKVRLAQVSRWPDGVKARMGARGASPAPTDGRIIRVKGGRARVRIKVIDG